MIDALKRATPCSQSDSRRRTFRFPGVGILRLEPIISPVVKYAHRAVTGLTTTDVRASGSFFFAPDMVRVPYQIGTVHAPYQIDMFWFLVRKKRCGSKDRKHFLSVVKSYFG